MRINSRLQTRIKQRKHNKMISSMLDHYYHPSKVGYFTKHYEKAYGCSPSPNMLKLFAKLNHDTLTEIIENANNNNTTA